FALAIQLERSLVSCRVGPVEYPVLPGGQPPENTCFHGLDAAESQVGLQARQGVGRQRTALFQCDAYLVVPIDAVGREGHQSQALGLLCADRIAYRGPGRRDGFGFFAESAGDAALTVDHRVMPE